MADNSADGIHPLIANRWSPRAFDAAVMPQGDLDLILRAATTAPSAYNAQPWRFLYATRDGAEWDLFLSLLVPQNAAWATNASVLVFFLSDTLMEYRGSLNPSHSHSFDTGAAWAMMTLQAEALGYNTHGMTGVDFDRTRTELQVPDRYRIEAAAAIGRKADPSILPDALRGAETTRTTRKTVAEIARTGRFDF